MFVTLILADIIFIFFRMYILFKVSGLFKLKFCECHKIYYFVTKIESVSQLEIFKMPHSFYHQIISYENGMETTWFIG